MQAYTRFRVADPDSFLGQARELLELWADQPGLIRVSVSRSTDDPQLYLLSSEWDGFGAYRRALGRVDVRMLLMPMALTALNEPGTFETTLSLDDGGAVVAHEPEAVPD